MKYTLRVTAQGVERVIDSGEDQIYVVFEIVDEEENVAQEKRLGFAVDADSDTIKAGLQAYLDNFQVEADAAPAQAEVDAQQEATQETVDSLKDLEITVTVKEEE